MNARHATQRTSDSQKNINEMYKKIQPLDP